MPVEIINTCLNPPLGLEWQMARALRCIDPAHVKGLAYLRLEDEMPTPDHRAAEWARKAVADGARVYGWYDEQASTGKSGVILYVHQIYGGVPSILWWSTLPTLRIVRSLAHEVGHHLVAMRGYVIRPGENLENEESLVNQYAASVVHNMMTRWSYRLGEWCLKDLAGWYYAFGAADWRSKKFAKAADKFYLAWDLDPLHEDYNYWYWRAREISDGESK